jgi:hypothetical protein
MLLVLVMMLAGKMVYRNNQEVVLQMPSLLRVMNLLKKQFFILERGQRGAHHMFGSTLPRKRGSLRIMGRHIYNFGLIATLRDASTRADVGVIMGQLVFGCT